ncbi:hypothetical protein SIID45300_01384 [Candidatus Magnetaquicoccaceae bacterium FCR-1]|uniref:Uncharacterized protein n=1 Tax=Candidatus Magnetaquiglobus chichijimensis TaxID=3141448 RepID=A0ABQ0C846_9PROT
MFNAIPAINLLGTSNPMLEQSNLVKVPHDIRTNNSERLEARNVETVKQNAKSRNARRRHESEEEEPEGGDESLPQPRHKPTIQERLLLARQGKVSLNQRAVNTLFLQQAKSGGVSRDPQSDPERPSIDVVA